MPRTKKSLKAKYTARAWLLSSPEDTRHAVLIFDTATSLEVVESYFRYGWKAQPLFDCEARTAARKVERAKEKITGDTTTAPKTPKNPDKVTPDAQPAPASASETAAQQQPAPTTTARPAPPHTPTTTARPASTARIPYNPAPAGNVRRGA